MGIGVTHTDFVMVPVSDFTRAVAFYGDLLGLERGRRWEGMPAQEFETGNLTITVADPSAWGDAFHTPSATTIALRVDDVAKARGALEAEGVTFTGDIIDSGVCHMTFFSDPDGNALMLHHRYAPHVP